MEIFPGRGITNLEFGLTRSQVEERLGLADKAFVTERMFEKPLKPSILPLQSQLSNEFPGKNTDCQCI